MTVALESRERPLGGDPPSTTFPPIPPHSPPPTHLQYSPPPGGKSGMSSEARVQKTVFRLGGS